MGKCNYNGSEQFAPLSPWAYFGFSILYSIPIVGFIALIINSFRNVNINSRNYARSFWCIYVVIAILMIILSSLGILEQLRQLRQ